ncbi:transglutaminase domain-containing protein [Terrimonas ferruginea]|uniref:transglutaminase domain-containing protein n=1 Tax=Terrimonas ferruginea TaxID=249 RepID=UPI00041C7EB6|nr:transglutaminase domain-containing protein [Terrimonas ferruginea]
MQRLFPGISAAILLFFSTSLQAQDTDNNVVVENKIQTFRFQTAAKGERVEIAEEYDVTFRCNDVRTEIPFSEMYDSTTTIDDVTIYVNGSKAKQIRPRYEYYSVESIFYSDARICYFSLPLEKRNSTSRVVLRRTHQDPQYFTSVYFTEPYLTEKKTVRFIIPIWMNAELVEYNFKGFDIRKAESIENNERIITYTLSNIPKPMRESRAPGSSYIRPHILVRCQEARPGNKQFVYFKTLQDQYKWYISLVRQVQDDQELLKKKATELTAGLSSDMEKVKAIFYWVQQHIRYIAFEDGIAGFRPAPAGDVLRKQYGDCKGMANLTRGLLKAIGLDARVCWLGTNHIAYDYSTPSMAVDNHMICAWIYKGKKYFLDATETNIGLNEYAERIQGRQVLIENGDSYLLETIPATTPEQNVQRETAKLHFANALDLKGDVQLSFKGESRSDLLNSIERTKKDNMQQSLISYLSKSNQDYAIENLQPAIFNTPDTLLNIQYHLHFRNAITAFDKELYAELDFRKEMNDFRVDAAKRQHDILLPYKEHIITEIELDIPAGYRVKTVPDNLKSQHTNADVSISYQQKPGKLIYRKEIRIKETWLRKADFEKWNTFINGLAGKYREQIVFEKN